MSQELRVVSTKELSDMLSIPEKTVRDWTLKKKIPYYKLGALVRFNPEEIKQWMEARKIGTLQEPLLRFRIPDHQ